MNNLKPIFTMFLCASCFTCVSQNYSPLIPDNDIENFIAWKLNINSFKTSHTDRQYFQFSPEIISWQLREIDFNLKGSNAYKNSVCIYNDRTTFLDTILTSDDRAFILQQKDSSRVSEWLMTIPQNKAAKKGYDYYFSLPLFSIDKKHVILKELYHCGEDCGEYRILFYSKTSNGWAFQGYLLGGVF